MSDQPFKSARSMGISVAWSQEDADRAVAAGKTTKYFGDKVQGEYYMKSEKVGPNESTIYHLRTEAGENLNVWGTTVLDGQFADGNDGAAIPLGAIVRITCNGKKQGKSGPSKQEGKGYWDLHVEFYVPAPSFKKAGVAEEKPEAGEEEGGEY